MRPKISIVIACYNDPHVIQAVKSAQKQTYSNKEIILIDDGSDPPVSKLIKNLRPEVDILLGQPNSGPGVARNKGIEKATGKYVLNLDSDDFFEKSFCEKAIRQMETDNQTKIVTCWAKRFNNQREIDIYTPEGGDYHNFLFSNAALGSALFRKDDWIATGGYETAPGIIGFEDWEFYLNILKTGGHAYVIDEVLFNYQVREDSITARITNQKEEKFHFIILKHKELYLQHFDGLLDVLFKRISEKEKETLKKTQSLEFRTGKKILGPLRYLKRKML